MTQIEKEGLYESPEKASTAGRPAAVMDAAEYLPDMETFGLGDAENIALLETLWDIMRRFVELGVDLGHADPCAQIFGEALELPAAASGGVKSSFQKATETPSGNGNQGEKHEQ